MASERLLSIGPLLGRDVACRENDRMTSGAGVRVTPRLWAVAALAALVLLAAGLVQVVLGSREQLLQLLVGTALSLAVVAATAWWAFTTRRVWKRWLNIAIATLAAANVLLGFLEFGYRQAAGALAIATGALAYATATRHALRPSPLRPSPPGPSARQPPPLWTTGSPDPGGPPSRPWLLVNPRSGDGKAGRVGLVEAARARGGRVHVLAEGDDPGALARRAVAEGADAVGVAGGGGGGGRRVAGAGGGGGGGGRRAVRVRALGHEEPFRRGPGPGPGAPAGRPGGLRRAGAPDRRGHRRGPDVPEQRVPGGLRRPGRRPPLPGRQAGHRPRRPAGVAARRERAAPGRPARRRRPPPPGRAGAAGGQQPLRAERRPRAPRRRAAPGVGAAGPDRGRPGRPGHHRPGPGRPPPRRRRLGPVDDHQPARGRRPPRAARRHRRGGGRPGHTDRVPAAPPGPARARPSGPGPVDAQGPAPALGDRPQPPAGRRRSSALRPDDLGQDRAHGPLGVVTRRPGAVADQVLEGRGLGAGPDPVGRGRHRPALGQPAVAVDPGHGGREQLPEVAHAVAPGDPALVAVDGGRLQGPGHGQDLGEVGEPQPQQPLQRLHRRQRTGLGDPAGEPAAHVMAAGHGHQQAGPVLEVDVEELAGDAGGGGDLGHGDGAHPPLADQAPGGVEDAGAGVATGHGHGSRVPQGVDTCQTAPYFTRVNPCCRRSRPCGQARTHPSRWEGRPSSGWSWRPRAAPGTVRPWSTARRGRRSATGCWPSGSGGGRPGWPPGGSGPGTCWRCGRPTCPSGPGWPSAPWPPAGP